MQTLSGSKIYISGVEQTSNLSISDYIALSYTEVGGVGSFGGVGSQKNFNKTSTWNSSISINVPGLEDLTPGTLELAREATDDGQAVLYDIARTNFSYAVKMVKQDGTVFYNRMLISGPVRPDGRSEDFDLEVFTLQPMQHEVKASTISTLDFVNNTYTFYGINFTFQTYPGLTFQRPTSAWAWDAAGKIVAFGSGAPRRTDLGLYVGAQAVGLFTRWDPTAAQIATKGNCADTTEPADAPLAGRNWIALDNTSALAYAYPATVSIPANTQVTICILVATQDGSQPVVGATDFGAYDFSLRGHNGNYLSSLSARYTRRSGNVWDVTVTGTTPGTGTSVFLGIARATTNNARPLKFSGFTAVAGPVASPPIIATGTALTVAPEVLSQALALPAAQDFTLAMRVVLGANPVSPFSQAILEWDDGSPSNRFLVHRQGNGAVEFLAVMAGVTSNRPSIAKSGPRDLSVVLRRSAGALQLAVDHGLLPTSVDVAGMPDLTRLWLGRRREGGSNVNGLIQRSLYLPRALSDAEMILL